MSAAYPDPRPEYERRLAARRQRYTALEWRDDVLANLRLLVFVAGLALGAAYFVVPISLSWLLLPAVLFVIAIVVHDAALEAKKRAGHAVRYYEQRLARLDGTWPGSGILRTDYVAEDHPYAADLDLFGEGSLFELLCTTRTRAGEETLARWLTEPATVAQIAARQGAVEQLRNRLDLREDVALQGGDVRATVNPESLVEWANAPHGFVPGSRAKQLIRILAWVMAITAVVAVGMWVFTSLGPVPLLGVAVIDAVILRWLRAPLRRVTEMVQQPQTELNILSVVLERLERERFDDPHLVMLQQELTVGGVAAFVMIRRLERLVTWLDAQRNQIWAIPAFFLLWNVHFGLAIEAWRARCGAEVGRWLSTLGALEALLALAAYAYDHPGDPFAEVQLGSDGPVLVANEIGHPLLPATSRVHNSLRLGGDSGVRVLIVSGSNMSGKSTLLRTLGVNVALAMAGAPVCAESLRLSPLQIGATLRVLDSLREGKSRFYAEISRLRQMMDLCGGELPVLFLLDEILQGTNSHDRQIGAEAIVRGLIDAGAVGLVTTHDLALAKAAESLAPRGRNVHFQDDLVAGELHFDYRLHDGVVRQGNALELMRSIGLRV